MTERSHDKRRDKVGHRVAPDPHYMEELYGFNEYAEQAGLARQRERLSIEKEARTREERKQHLLHVRELRSKRGEAIQKRVQELLPYADEVLWNRLEKVLDSRPQQLNDEERWWKALDEVNVQEETAVETLDSLENPPRKRGRKKGHKVSSEGRRNMSEAMKAYWVRRKAAKEAQRANSD